MTTATSKPLDSGTRLAIDRTQLAHERTLMAWVRTATSLITFGFTLYKFFEFEAGKRIVETNSPLISPRHFAMVMIGTGLVALLFSAADHRRSLKRLHDEYGVVFPRSFSLVVAAVVSILGLLGFAAALFRA
jgi:putative membrane protein